MNLKQTLLANALARNLSTMFPGFFGSGWAGTKHNHYADFGYPETIEFDKLFMMYTRNGLAQAVVNKTVQKTWETYPFLLEREDKHQETTIESDIRQRFDDLCVWQAVAEADARSLVGGYSGLILRFADNKSFQETVDRVAGLEGLVEVIPAWAGQLTVSSWDTNEQSENYGKPAMFQFNEASVPGQSQQPRSFVVHPDRVIVWSKDGSVNCRSLLESCYNALIDAEKIRGAGGEGFWKNAKGAPVLETDKDVDPQTMAKAMGVSLEDLPDKMNDQVEGWQKGFDQLLWLQGIEAKTLSIDLPDPEHFYAAPVQEIASSASMPLRILVGNQTGERASTEDADSWSQTCMARRANYTDPGIRRLISRLERVGVLPERDWSIQQDDLTEPSKAEKIERASKMADVNQKMSQSGEIVFTGDEIRETISLEPLSDADKYRDESGDVSEDDDISEEDEQ